MSEEWIRVYQQDDITGSGSHSETRYFIKAAHIPRADNPSREGNEKPYIPASSGWSIEQVEAFAFRAAVRELVEELGDTTLWDQPGSPHIWRSERLAKVRELLGDDDSNQDTPIS